MSHLKCLGVPLVCSVSRLDMPARRPFEMPTSADIEPFEMLRRAARGLCELIGCAGEEAF